MITAEEAQALTEYKWERQAHGESERGDACGWCDYTRERSPSRVAWAPDMCRYCPATTLSPEGKPTPCESLPVMSQHLRDSTAENAQAVLDFLEEHGPALIAAAKEMHGEE